MDWQIADIYLIIIYFIIHNIVTLYIMIKIRKHTTSIFFYNLTRNMRNKHQIFYIRKYDIMSMKTQGFKQGYVFKV